MHRCYVYIAVLALLAAGVPAHAQTSPPVTAPSAQATTPAIDPEKEKLIRQLLEVTGTSKLMQQMNDQMFSALQAHMSDVPAEFWTKLRLRFKSDELITLLIPVYDKYYTKDDLAGLLAFYGTPLGQKVVATTPLLSRESMEIGETWGQKQAQKVVAEIEQERKVSKKRPAAKAKTM